jgi:hypothetical protein
MRSETKSLENDFMFPISIQSRLDSNVSSSNARNVLDSIVIELKKEGISNLNEENYLITFKNNGMILEAYKKFSLVSSGYFLLEERDKKLTVNYKILLWKILVGFVPVSLLSFGIIKANNISAINKIELVAFFFVWFFAVAYLIAMIRLRRWLARCVDSVSSERH